MRTASPGNIHFTFIEISSPDHWTSMQTLYTWYRSHRTDIPSIFNNLTLEQRKILYWIQNAYTAVLLYIAQPCSSIVLIRPKLILFDIPIGSYKLFMQSWFQSPEQNELPIDYIQTPKNFTNGSITLLKDR